MSKSNLCGSSAMNLRSTSSEVGEYPNEHLT